MEENEVLKTSFAVDIMLQICEGLSRIHIEGIVHRDLTPNNILIDDTGVVKIIDLDISRIKKETKSVDTTLMGTEGYTAPEQFGFRQTDERADIYSLGVLFNAMLTGFLPIEKKYKGDIVIEKIISRCTEIEVSKRYKSADELRRILLSVATEKDGTAKRFFKSLPGFRTHRRWKEFFSTAFYFVMILVLCFFGIFPLRRVDIKFFCQFILTFLCTVTIPWLIATNYLYYMDRIPVIKKINPIVKQCICLIVAIAFSLSSFLIWCEILL
jgi:serine/threonine protein kinase